jgi:succinate dehydrogenase flavoprotein subunit
MKATKPELPPDAGEGTLARIDRLRNAKGATPTSVLRLQMRRAMQSYATVFRTGSILREGKEALREIWNGLSDIAVSDRSMIRNSDLVETLEFENLRLQATRWWIRLSPARRAAVLALARISKRDDQNWMKHTLAWVDPNGAVRSDYRPVHTYTLSKDIQYIEPTARVYRTGFFSRHES